jgi:hypothetical protein
VPYQLGDPPPPVDCGLQIGYCGLLHKEKARQVTGGLEVSRGVW